MAEYFYLSNGKEFGPFSSQQLRQLAQEGNLEPNDVVWKLGSNKKIRAQSIDGLEFANTNHDAKSATNSATVQSEKQEYHVITNNGLLGPYSPLQLRRLARNGQLNRTDQVKVNSSGEILSAEEIKGLFDGFSKPTPGKNSESSFTPSKNFGSLPLNQEPIVREAKPGLLRSKVVGFFADRVLLLSKWSFFSRRICLEEHQLSGSIEDLAAEFGSPKEIKKENIKRLVASKLPAWISGKRSSVIVESVDGRSIKFQCWADQLPAIVEWLPQKSYLRKGAVSTLADLFMAIVIFIVCIFVVPISILLLTQNSAIERQQALDIPAPVANVGADKAFPVAAMPLWVGLPELFMIAILIAGIPCTFWIFGRVIRRPCWSRLDAVVSVPIALWGAIPLIVLVYNHMTGRNPDSEILSLPAIGVGLLFLAICLYFPIRILVGDRLAKATPNDFAAKPKKSWLRFAVPFRNNALSWVLKTLGLGGMIAFWSPLTLPVFQAIDENLGSTASAFYAGILFRFVFTAPPAVLLYLGYRLSQRPPITSENDQRRPILFLRPFNDDQAASIQPSSFLSSLSGIDKSIGSYGDQASERGRMKLSYLWMAVHPVRVLRLFFNRCVDTAEESVVRFFSKIAPVYAIGKPGEVLPTPGANRLYPGEQWQSVVLDYLERSQAVIIQPGVSEGVVWELQQIRSTVPHHRVLINLVSFQRNPEAYERLRQILFEAWGTRLPRKIPFQDGCFFLWLDKDWQPIIQETSYSCPLTWPITGNTINLGHTLQPFIQGMQGGVREPPRKPRWKSGFSYSAIFLPTVCLALLVAFLPIVSLNLLTGFYNSNSRDHQQIAEIPEWIGSNSSDNRWQLELNNEQVAATQPRARKTQKTYRGKNIRFEFRLGNDWNVSPQPALNVEFHCSNTGVGLIEVLSLDKVRLTDLYDPSFGSDVRKSVEALVKNTVPLATTELVDDQWTEVNGVRWRALSILQKYPFFPDEVRYSFYTSGPEGSIVVHLILNSNNQAPKFRDEFMSSFQAPKSDLDLLLQTSKSGVPILYRGKKSGLAGKLNRAWIPMNLKKSLEEMDEIGNSLREVAQASELVFQLGTEPRFGSLEIDVIDYQDEPFIPSEINEQDCRAFVQQREDMMSEVFDGKLNYSAELVKFRVVSRSSREWLELHINQTFSSRGFQKSSVVVQRLIKRNNQLVSVNVTQDLKHPLVDEMTSNALDAFKFEYP